MGHEKLNLISSLRLDKIKDYVVLGIYSRGRMMNFGKRMKRLCISIALCGGGSITRLLSDNQSEYNSEKEMRAKKSIQEIINASSFTLFVEIFPGKRTFSLFMH